MKRDGFTIIEVIIFLAISGLMLTMAMVGSGNLARQARFSDTVNSFHSTLQREYEEVVSGVNTRSSTQPGCSGGAGTQTGTDDCLLLGKVISFDQNGGNTVTIRTVTDTPTSPAYSTTGTIYTQIINANPQISTVNARTDELSWGASFQVASRNTDRTNASDLYKVGTTRAIVNNIAFLRGPASGQIIPYYFYTSNLANVNGIESSLQAAVVDWNKTSNTEANICILNSQEYSGGSSPVAAIRLGVGKGSVAIETNFEPSRGDDNTKDCRL